MDIFEYAKIKKMLGGSGGGGGNVPAIKDSGDWNTVNFYDYDGSLLYQYPVEKAHKLTELPPLPSHEGLICQGWNYTLNDILAHDTPLDIGANYITDDGATRFYISVQNEEFLEFTLGPFYLDGITINWGDGTQETFVKGKALTHKYENIGDYCISIMPPEGNVYYIPMNKGSFYRCLAFVKKIELGSRFYFDSGDAPNQGYFLSLETITFPIDYRTSDKGTVSSTVANLFDSAPIKCVIMPPMLRFNTLGGYEFRNSGLEVISIPTLIGQSVTQCAPYRYTFYGCKRLKRLCLPKGCHGGQTPDCFSYTGIKFLAMNESYMGYQSSFQDNYYLERIVFGKDVETTSFGLSNTFAGCKSLRYVDFPPISKLSYYSETSGGDDFQNCYFLTKLRFASTFSAIRTRFCYNCYYLKTFDFSLCKQIPIMMTTPSSAFPSTLPADYEILVPSKLYFDWIEAINWKDVASHIKPTGGAGIQGISPKILYFDSSTNITLGWISSDGLIPSSISVSSDVPDAVSISNESIGDSTISFDVTSLQTETPVTLTISLVVGEETVTRDILIYVFETDPEPTYRVEPVDGVSYGFALNDDGYYESTNQGLNYSYSLCKVIFNTWGTHKMIADCVNYAQQYYDYGILSKVDTELKKDYQADAAAMVKQSFSNHVASENVISVDYGNTGIGEHFIYVKYIKNGSTDSNRDSFQFKIRFEEE